MQYNKRAEKKSSSAPHHDEEVNVGHREVICCKAFGQELVKAALLNLFFAPKIPFLCQVKAQSGQQ